MFLLNSCKIPRKVPITESVFNNIVTSYFFTGIKPWHLHRQIAQREYQALRNWSNLRPKEMNSQKKKKCSLPVMYSLCILWHFLWRSSKIFRLYSDASSTLAPLSLFACVDGVGRGGSAVNEGESADGLGADVGVERCRCNFALIVFRSKCFFLRKLQEFRNNFFKEHHQKATSATFHHIKIKHFELKPSFWFSVDSWKKGSTTSDSRFRFYFCLEILAFSLIHVTLSFT